MSDITQGLIQEAKEQGRKAIGKSKKQHQRKFEKKVAQMESEVDNREKELMAKSKVYLQMLKKKFVGKQ